MNATTKVHTITVTIDVTDKDVDDIMANALDAVGYWVEKVEVEHRDYCGGHYTSEVISRGGALKFYPAELPKEDGPKVFRLTLQDFLKGLSLYIRARGIRMDDEGIDVGDIDQPRADSIVQFALFGEEVYG